MYYLHPTWPIRDLLHCWILPPLHLFLLGSQASWLLLCNFFCWSQVGIFFPVWRSLSFSSNTPFLHDLKLATGFQYLQYAYDSHIYFSSPASLTSSHRSPIVSKMSLWHSPRSHLTKWHLPPSSWSGQNVGSQQILWAVPLINAQNLITSYHLHCNDPGPSQHHLLPGLFQQPPAWLFWFWLHLYSPHSSQSDPFKSDSVSLVIQSLQELPAHLYSGLGSLLEWVPCLLLPSWYTTHRDTVFSLLLNTAGTACCSAFAAVPSGWKCTSSGLCSKVTSQPDVGDSHRKRKDMTSNWPVSWTQVIKSSSPPSQSLQCRFCLLLPFPEAVPRIQPGGSDVVSKTPAWSIGLNPIKASL